MKLANSRLLIGSGLVLASLVVLFFVVAQPWKSSAYAGQAPQSITITAKDVSFDTDTIAAKVGQPITIHLVDDDDMDHALSIDTLNVETDVIGPGQMTAVTFTPAQAGKYRFYCPIAAHAKMGMVGTLEVAP